MEAASATATTVAATEKRAVLPRRQRIVVWAALISTVLSVGGLVASLFVKSPQQLIADAAPPKETLLTAPVERRILASTLVTRGTVEASASVEVTPVSTTAGAQVVTSVRIKPGNSIKAGQVLLAVSGRPLIALSGHIPPYRDLKPGDTGDDVAQLQRALRALGHSTKGDRSGVFGAATKTAVRHMYADRGYDAPDTGGPGGRGDKQQLAEAEAAVAEAQSAVDAIRRRISSGEKAAPSELPLPEQLRALRARLQAAKTTQSELVATTGTMLPLAEVVFLPSFPARVTAFAAKVGDPVQAPLVTLSAGDLRVRAHLRPEQGDVVKPGMKVQLSSETLGQDVHGSVTSVGEVTVDTTTNREGESETGTPYRPAVVTPIKDLPAQWSGLDVRVTITAAQTDGEVFVVPLSAVSAGADGKTTVSVVGAGDEIRRVEVEAGISGGGFVAVEPVVGALEEGDRVVVSTESNLAEEPSADQEPYSERGTPGT